jgi:hypothetical protein
MQGEGVVMPRHGGNVKRVGLLGRMQNKRFVDGAIDYSTNVTEIETLYLIN